MTDSTVGGGERESAEVAQQGLGHFGLEALGLDSSMASSWFV